MSLPARAVGVLPSTREYRVWVLTSTPGTVPCVRTNENRQNCGAALCGYSGVPQCTVREYSRVPLGTADEEGAVLAHARRDVPERHRLPVRADRPCNAFIIANHDGATGSKLRAAQVQPVGRRRAARRGARRLLPDVRLVEGGHGGFRGP